MPRDVPFSIAISGDEFSPWTQSSHKFRFYQQPKLAEVDPIEVAVGNIVPVFVKAAEGSEFFEPMPISQTLQLNNMVSVSTDDSSTGPSQMSPIKCKFGRFGETTGVLANATHIKCTSPATDESPDSIYRETVTIGVAMNG